jgi:NADH-quinone oxidoreductase subunit L
VTAICLFLFVGCTGKSAQIPLYVWLPDAMAGPTPVSALIHAATMVTSGIYLVARLNYMYALSPMALEVVAWVGGLTAFLAATIAIVQTDIKKVLAYSTVSQLGYMFLGCGVAASAAGVFHVITHAFFKALLFLGAGSVIHGMHEEQDILKMGGLRKHMPQTFLVFTVAWLAICGLPPFSGFFSKDEILWMAFASEHGNKILWALGLLTAMMTAFYMTRLWVLTFFGKERFDHHKVHPHESPLVMIAPLFVLAVLSALGGFMGFPHASWLEHWLSPVIPPAEASHEVAESMEWILMAVSVAAAAVGIFVSYRLYQNLDRMTAWKQRFAGLHKFLWNKWFVDEVYEGAIVKPIGGLSQLLWKKFDVAVIDRVVLSFGWVSEWTGQTLRLAQTGSLQVYAVVLLFGLVLTVGYMIYGMA